MAEVRILPGGVAELERAAANGLADLGQWIEAEAKRIAPVGGSSDPHAGRLRNSIHVVREIDGSVRVVADAPEAIFNEFGTVNMRAQPFLTPAFTAGLGHVQEIVGGRMARELR